MESGLHDIEAGLHEPVRERACRLRNARRWSALAQFLDSLAIEPRLLSDELKLLRAESALRMGDAHKAVELSNLVLAETADIPALFKARALLVLSAAARLRGFSAKALEDASAAIAVLRDVSPPLELVIEGHKQLGIALGMAGELDQAMEQLERALALCSGSHDLALLADVHKAIGIVLLRLDQLPEAQVHFGNAADAYRKLASRAELSDVLNDIAWVHYLLGEYQLSLEVLEEALALARESNYPRAEAMILINMGEALRELGSYSRALEAYRGALGFVGEALEPRLHCFASIGLGSVHCALGEFEKSRFFLRQASYEAERLKLPYELAIAHLTSGILAHREADDARAEKELTRCVALLQGVGSPRPLVKAHLFLASVFLRTRQWANLSKSIESLAKTVRGLDLVSQLVRDAKGFPDVIDYAVSKRIGGKFFTMVRARLDGAEGGEAAASEKPLTGVGDERACPPMAVYSLGQLEVLVDGRKISHAEWESQKAKELFIYLFCHRRGKTREELLEVLWPEISVNMSRNAFYNNVYRTRRATYKDSIVLEDGLYKLNPRGEFWFDLEEFQGLVQRAERMPRGSEERASLMAQAVKLYRGSFLEDFYAEWADTIRLEAETQYLHSLARLAGFHAGRGGYSEARGLLGKLLAVDKTDVDANEQLIRILIRSGDMGHALRQFNVYKRLTIAELGAEPPKDFRQLCSEAGVKQ